MPDSPPAALAPFLTDAHRRLWEHADAFAAAEIAPRAARADADPTVVEREIPRLLSQQGWFGVTLPEDIGGMQAGHVARVILVHRLARVSAAAAAILQASLIPIGALHHFYGGRRRTTQLLLAVSEMRALPSIAVTEPDHGGHLGGIQTTAERTKSGWILTGAKTSVGNSHVADFHIVVARTAGPGVRTSQALTAFIVDATARGVTLAAHRPALGLHGFSFGEIRLDGVRVRDDQRLGEIGEGFAVAQSSSILYGRPNLAAVDRGLHERAVSLAVRHTATRPRHGSTLADLGVVQDRLGRITANTHIARLLLYHAAHLLDQGLPCDQQLITAKLTGHELAADSGQAALELHGAHALHTDHPLARIWQDIQTTYAPAGTGEIQRLRLAQAAVEEETTPHDQHRPQWSQLFADRLRHHPPLTTAA
ncbi:acyl-CoA dehydrogenase family protein [Streptomyces acidiscabies]|uniref:acyl-CoA dehydrogenase family protein n=1 Tax=Streptomyces acidiscabies TaxID=42234 RepID=UPI000952518A|nr:acyl-CoA dehydrogenase family protein [Streptomyces acidiscabies]